MGTREILSGIMPLQPSISSIDFERLDNFVQTLISGFIAKNSPDTVKDEIEEDDGMSKTSNFLTHIVEVGSLNVLNENNLLNSVSEEELVVVVMAQNISLATALKKKGLYNWDIPFYYNMDALGIVSAPKNHTVWI